MLYVRAIPPEVTVTCDPAGVVVVAGVGHEAAAGEADRDAVVVGDEPELLHAASDIARTAVHATYPARRCAGRRSGLTAPRSFRCGPPVECPGRRAARRAADLGSARASPAITL